MNSKSKLINNSVINASFFSVSALLSLINITLIIRYFGIELQGWIALAKLLTPAGYFALLNLGLPAVISRRVASDTGDKSSKEILLWLKLGFIFSAVVGLGLSLIFLLGLMFTPLGDSINQVLGLSSITDEIRQWIYFVLILGLPVQFMGIVAQAVLIGKQSFLPIRTSEVLTSLFALLGTLYCVLTDFESKQLVLLVLLLEALRGVYLLASATKEFGLKSVLKNKVSKNLFTEFLHEVRVCYRSSFVTYFDTTLPSYLVLMILGPSALGVFDTITKISKIIKNAFGFFNSALIPHSIQKESQLGNSVMPKFFMNNLFVISFVLTPLIFLISSSSQFILRNWFGENLSGYFAGMAYSLFSVYFLILAALQAAIFSKSLKIVDKTTNINIIENLVALPILYLQLASFGINSAFINRFVLSLVGWVLRARIITKEYSFALGHVFISILKPAVLSLLAYAFSFFVFKDYEGNFWLYIFLQISLFLFLLLVIYISASAQQKNLLSQIKSHLIDRVVVIFNKLRIG